MTDTMTDEKALGLVRWLLNGSDATPPPPDVTLEQAYNHIAARLAQQPAMAPALDVFKIAGGDVECSPEPTAEIALDCLRDLRQCYEEVLSQQPAAALPDMAAFDKAMQKAMDAAQEWNYLTARDQWHELRTLHAQALASRVQVPEVTDEDIFAGLEAINSVPDGFRNNEFGGMRACLTADRARLLASAEQGAK